MHYIVAAIGGWNRSLFELRSTKLPGQWSYVSQPAELTEVLSRGATPRYIFFLHWRWIVPSEITSIMECVCFHMTDVPYGRGGSPLQNLILRGHEKTKLTSLQMTDGIDAGPVYMKKSLSLSGSAQEIYERAAGLSWDMISKIISIEPLPVEQMGEVIEFKRRSPEESKIPPYLSIKEIYDYVRMLDADGYPRAFIETESYKLLFDGADLDSDNLTARVTFLRKDTPN